jgi:hypothetical protein
MNIYLAARYTRRLELCGYRDELTALGHEVTSRWLNGSHQLDNEGRPLGDTGELLFEAGSPQVDHFRWKFAQDDLEDVLASETLIAFTEEPRSGNSRGGRHVELGIALGTGRHRIVIVGPRENVFCWLPQAEWYPDWAHLVIAWSPGSATGGPDGNQRAG